MRRKIYRDARRVLWIVDNGSSHRGDASIQRLEGRKAQSPTFRRPCAIAAARAARPRHPVLV